MDSSGTSSKIPDTGSMTRSPQDTSGMDRPSHPTSDDSDLTYFLKSNIECMERPMRNLRAYIEERRSEQERYLESIGSELDLNRCQMMILRDHLGGRKLFSITEIANRYGVSYQTARNHVNGLLRMGLVHAHSKDGKTVLYIVSDNIRV